MNVDELLGIAQGCLGSVADQVLGWEATQLENTDLSATVDGIYALIPVESNRSSVEISFSVNKDHAEILSRQMLMLEDDEPFPDDMDVADTLGEIANITAGELKKALLNQGEKDVTLGIPATVNGSIRWRESNQQFVRVADSMLGPVHTKMIVIYKPKSAAQNSLVNGSSK